MAANFFIDVLNRKFSASDYFHPESHGDGLPRNDLRNFMFATGIECSYPTIDYGRVCPYVALPGIA